MCKWGTDEMVKLCKPKEVSGRTSVSVDSCIAPIIQALNDDNIYTIGCCCGHGESVSSVIIRLNNMDLDLAIKAVRYEGDWINVGSWYEQHCNLITVSALVWALGWIGSRDETK